MHFIIHAFEETLNLIPFLFITYLMMEYLEHHSSSKLLMKIEKSKHFGPIFASTFGLLPQCGFSTISSSLYVTGIITRGSLIAIYLATSDEMLPIFLSNKAPLKTIISILALKFILGIIIGYLIDLIWKKQDARNIKDFCATEKCHCQHNSILKSALIHTLKISGYIYVFTLAIIILTHSYDLEAFINQHQSISIILTALIGLIPNCAPSVVMSTMYLNGLLSFPALMAGLLPNAGLGLLVLFRVNKNHKKENILLVLILLLTGIITGFILNIF